MTDLEEIPEPSFDDVLAHRWTDEERRAMTLQFINEHLIDIDRRVRAIRVLLAMLVR